MNRSLFFILVAVFFQSCLWAVLIPIWHYPDEQAHFTQVQDYAELGKVPGGAWNQSLEIYLTTRVLETYRDKGGNNQFTGHPEHRLVYAPGSHGLEENWLKQIPKRWRTIMVKAEAPKYPPLYYLYSAGWYRLVMGADIFTRIYAVRVGSILLQLINVVFAWNFFSVLFKRQKMVVGATWMYAFMPMLMFVQSGINNDVLLNCLATGILWLLIRDWQQPITISNTLGMLVLVGLGILTKQLIYLLLPVVGWQILRRAVKYRHMPKSLVWLGLVGVGLLSGLIKVFNEGFWQPYWPKVQNFSLTAFGSLLSVRLKQLYRETLPWYWGVYKWLSVVLPLWLLRLIKVMMLLSGLGWIRQWLTKNQLSKCWWPVWLVNLTYLMMLLTWDIFLTMKVGFGHGIQGRYFFLLGVTHVAWLVYGWINLIPKKGVRWVLELGPALMIGLNYYSLYYVASQYYDVSSLPNFIAQVGQYRPDLLKSGLPMMVLVIGSLGAIILGKGELACATMNRWKKSVN